MMTFSAVSTSPKLRYTFSQYLLFLLLIRHGVHLSCPLSTQRGQHWDRFRQIIEEFNKFTPKCKNLHRKIKTAPLKTNLCSLFAKKKVALEFSYYFNMVIVYVSAFVSPRKWGTWAVLGRTGRFTTPGAGGATSSVTRRQRERTTTTKTTPPAPSRPSERSARVEQGFYGGEKNHWTTCDWKKGFQV